MQVFKFGGSVLQDVKSLQRACDIIASEIKKDFKIILVVSAFAKTTSKLEELCEGVKDVHTVKVILDYLYKFHLSFLANLKPPSYNKALNDVNQIFHQIIEILSLFNHEIKKANLFFSWDNSYCNASLPQNIEKTQLYNEIVTKGEYLATKILHSYLLDKKISCKWLDASHLIKTDSLFNVNYSLTKECTKKVFSLIKESIVITQGFIGSNRNTNLIETLGREGSDYSAAILGSSLNASKVVLWKDVSGIMNADPCYFKSACQYNTLSYDNMQMIANLGSKVVHPKTLNPLKNENIPLYVRSFNDVNKLGTLVLGETQLPEPYFLYLNKNQDAKHSHFIKVFFWQKYDLSFFEVLFNKQGIAIYEAQDLSIMLELGDYSPDDVKICIDKCWDIYKREYMRVSI